DRVDVVAYLHVVVAGGKRANIVSPGAARFGNSQARAAARPDGCYDDMVIGASLRITDEDLDHDDRPEGDRQLDRVVPGPHVDVDRLFHVRSADDVPPLGHAEEVHD